MGVSDLLVTNTTTHLEYKVNMMNQTTTLRELTDEEVSQVSGGLLPVLAEVGSFATHHAVRSIGQYYLSRALTSYSIYNRAVWWKTR